MFDTKTTFILGAGASCEAGLPSGTALAKTIGQKMDVWWDDSGKRSGDGDLDLVSEVSRGLAIPIIDVSRSATRIRDGIVLSSSIDDFLDQHQADPVILALGKAAIVKTIVEAEKNSLLALRDRTMIDFAKLEDRWYVKFARMLGRQVRVADVDSIFSNVSFVSFNYDRTLEHFLSYALRAAFGIDADHANRLVGAASIVHAYGSIGALPGVGSGDTLPFGAIGTSSLDYLKLAARIRTYTESTTSDLRTEIQTALNGAMQLVFLGFGFHQQNMELLTTPDRLDGKKVFATVHGLSNSDQAIVARRIGSLFKTEVQTARALAGTAGQYDDCTCHELFERYRLAMSA